MMLNLSNHNDAKLQTNSLNILKIATNILRSGECIIGILTLLRDYCTIVTDDILTNVLVMLQQCICGREAAVLCTKQGILQILYYLLDLKKEKILVRILRIFNQLLKFNVIPLLHVQSLKTLIKMSILSTINTAAYVAVEGLYIISKIFDYCSKIESEHDKNYFKAHELIQYIILLSDIQGNDIVYKSKYTSIVECDTLKIKKYIEDCEKHINQFPSIPLIFPSLINNYYNKFQGKKIGKHGENITKRIVILLQNLIKIAETMPINCVIELSLKLLSEATVLATKYNAFSQTMASYMSSIMIDNNIFDIIHTLYKQYQYDKRIILNALTLICQIFNHCNKTELFKNCENTTFMDLISKLLIAILSKVESVKIDESTTCCIRRLYDANIDIIHKIMLEKESILSSNYNILSQLKQFVYEI